MSTSTSAIETSRPQLIGAVLSLGLATLTFVLPLALALLFATGIVAFAAAAKSLHLTHGLEPGPFSAGFYLAALLLLGAGGWQLVQFARAFRAWRAAKADAHEEVLPEHMTSPRSRRLPAVLTQRPWMLLGTVLLLVDMSLVRLDIRGRLDSPDGILAAAILASMVWATLFIFILSVRATRVMWRTLLRGSRQSPYFAGWVTAACLAISLASVLTIHRYAKEAAETASQQNVVASIEEAPSADSSIEQIRQAFATFSEPKKPNDEQDQHLVKAQEPSAKPQVIPAGQASAQAEDAADSATDSPDTLSPTETAAAAAGVAGAGMAGLLPSSSQTADRPPTTPTPAAAIPAETSEPAAPTEPTETDEPFLGLSFGPPFAGCVDRLTERNEHGDPIEQHIRRLMARFGISAHDARAVVFETLVSVCMKKAEDREDLSRYFWRSVTNAARNFLSRHLNGRRTCPIELVPVVDFPDDQDAWRYVEDTEQRAQRAFCSLSDIDQAIIQARVVRGLKFAQIAALVDLSEDGARKAFDRAIRRLKENFQKK